MKTIKVQDETWESVTELRNLIIEKGLNNLNINNEALPNKDFSKLTRDIVIKIPIKQMISQSD